MLSADALEKKRRLEASGLTIYDRVPFELFYEIEELEVLISHQLLGVQLAGPIRTRSRLAKALVCEALGYQVPSSFARTKPRFPGQHLDVFVQKADNLQIFNVAEIEPELRFVLIRVDAGDIVGAVRVRNGATVASWDSTGTLTSKFQARRKRDHTGNRLVADSDTPEFIAAFDPRDRVSAEVLALQSPTAAPRRGDVLSIAALYAVLAPALAGRTLEHLGYDQERNRGTGLHRLVCRLLGLGSFADMGQFPDIRCQALEVKFHLAPTIDLGRGSPDSESPAPSVGAGLAHKDARYLVGYGELIPRSGTVEITDVVLTTGANFFEEFDLMGGLGQNTKLQIPLPRDLFGR